MKVKEKIIQALARGYCSPENSGKEVDIELINSMSDEVIKVIDEIEELIVDLLSEIEDASPAGTEILSEELMEKINKFFPDEN
tara:strand:- start:10891 stop:11139 length:249 start_codon:yes stop_codon:yes gene_type:complete